MKKNIVNCLKLLSIMLISINYSCAKVDLKSKFSRLFSKIIFAQNIVTTDVIKEENQTTYTTTYPLKENGLVRIRTENMHQDPALEVNLTIKRHHAETVIVQGIVDLEVTKIVDNMDRSGDDDNRINVPWHDDTTPDFDHYCHAQRYDTIRGGGSRLLIEIRERGNYIITVPYDADTKAKLSTGTINYASNEPTILKIDSTTVNRWGNSGSSGGDRQSWEYYWGKRGSPMTKLFINKGHINVSRHN